MSNSRRSMDEKGLTGSNSSIRGSNKQSKALRHQADTDIDPQHERLTSENRHLQQSVIHMRQRIDSEQLQKQQVVDQLKADHAQEISQMGKTIFEMREQLEKAAVDRERVVSHVRNTLGAQVAELQKMIQALRQQLEDEASRRASAIDAATQVLKSENHQLKEAVQATRDQLDSLRAGLTKTDAKKG